MANTLEKPFIAPVDLPQLYGNSTLRAINGQGSLNINIRRYYTDSQGAVIDKTAVSIPSSLKTRFPIFLLGNFDRIGGYNISLKTVQMPAGIVFLMTYVNGYDKPFLQESGFSTIQNFLRKGDIVSVFTNDYNNPTSYVFIVQTCDYGALASIISNTMTQQDDGSIGLMLVQRIKYQVDNENQLQNVWQIVSFDNLGQFKQHPLNPLTYKNPYYRLSDFLQIELSFIMTQYTAVNFMMDYATDALQVNFEIQK